MIYPKLFIPGPTPVAEDTLAAMGQPQVGHRTPEFSELWAEVTAGLEKVRIHDLRHHVGSMIGDNYHVATVAKILGNTKAAAMRYIHAGDAAVDQAASELSKSVTALSQPNTRRTYQQRRLIRRTHRD